ncbi:MAG TPA: hypothetical protein VI874_03565 [Candidatus Norongarragalinales archaeon]|nr:hypothetical protein [Candidatus Norongarragalinales archaeon]
MKEEHGVHCEILDRAAPHFDASMRKETIQDKLANIADEIKRLKKSAKIDMGSGRLVLSQLMLTAGMITRPLLPREHEGKFIQGKRIIFDTMNEWRTGGAKSNYR